MLALTVLLGLPGLAAPGPASVPFLPSTPPPLCRTVATYTPVSWPSWTPPEQRFRRITIRLRPGCPEGGEANISLFNPSGRRLPEFGTYTLTPERPILYVPDRPPFSVTTPNWVIWWRARSGLLYAVPQRPVSRGGETP